MSYYEKYDKGDSIYRRQGRDNLSGLSDEVRKEQRARIRREMKMTKSVWSRSPSPPAEKKELKSKQLSKSNNEENVKNNLAIKAKTDQRKKSKKISSSDSSSSSTDSSSSSSSSDDDSSDSSSSSSDSDSAKRNQKK